MCRNGMLAPSRVRIAAAVGLALAGTGCETFGSHMCDTSVMGNPAVTYAGGSVEGGVYLSSAWDGELLSFPGGMVYSLDHHLVDAQQEPVVPRWVSLWITLDRHGIADGGTIARASGNEAVLLGVGSTTITVQNDGCQDYWLLVGAGTGATQPSPP